MKQQPPCGTPEDLSVLIDEYGDLQAELAAMKPKLDRAKFLREHFESLPSFKSKPADKDFIESGKRYDLVVTKRANAREFKAGAMKKLARLIGATFWSLCKITMADFDDYVALPLRKQYVEEARTGARKYDAIRKAQVKAA